MFLDKVNTELAIRVVYASVGPAAVEQATILGEQAAATMAVKAASQLFGGSVRMQQLKMPKLMVKGFTVCAHVVGISLTAFRAAPGATAELEVGALTTDGLVFVVEPEQSALRDAYEHARSRPLGELLAAAVIAPAGFDVGAALGNGAADVPVVSGRRAAMDALQAVMKPLLLDLVKRTG